MTLLSPLLSSIASLIKVQSGGDQPPNWLPAMAAEPRPGPKSFVEKIDADWPSCVISSAENGCEVTLDIIGQRVDRKLPNYHREEDSYMDDNSSAYSGQYDETNFGRATGSSGHDAGSDNNVWTNGNLDVENVIRCNGSDSTGDDDIRYLNNSEDDLSGGGNGYDHFISPKHSDVMGEDDIQYLLPENEDEDEVPDLNVDGASQKWDRKRDNDSEMASSPSSSSHATQDDILAFQRGQLDELASGSSDSGEEMDMPVNGSESEVRGVILQNTETSSNYVRANFCDDSGNLDASDVEDAYHAIFGEEKKGSRANHSRNGDTSVGSTSPSDVNNNNVAVTELSATIGSKRDSKGRIKESKEPTQREISVLTDVEILFGAGSIIRITEGEYCDWDGEILCVDDNRRYTSRKGNKCTEPGQPGEYIGVYYAVAPQYSNGIPVGNCTLISQNGVAVRKDRTTDEVFTIFKGNMNTEFADDEEEIDEEVEEDYIVMDFGGDSSGSNRKDSASRELKKNERSNADKNEERLKLERENAYQLEIERQKHREKEKEKEREKEEEEENRKKKDRENGKMIDDMQWDDVCYFTDCATATIGEGISELPNENEDSQPPLRNLARSALLSTETSKLNGLTCTHKEELKNEIVDQTVEETSAIKKTEILMMTRESENDTAVSEIRTKCDDGNSINGEIEVAPSSNSDLMTNGYVHSELKEDGCVERCVKEAELSSIKTADNTSSSSNGSIEYDEKKESSLLENENKHSIPFLESFPDEETRNRYYTYVSLRDINMTNVGRRVRVTATDNKYR